MIDRAKAYIDGVLSGEIVAGKWIKLAMQRHVDDLGRDWEYYFDEDEAERILGLYEMFRFSKGDVSGQPFDLMPWFASLVYMAFGWRRPDGGKRFSKVYCKVARGNAKTANLVTVGTIGFMFEGVSDPEVFWIAMNKEQARIGWDRQREMLRLMVEDFPELDGEIHLPDGRFSSHISKKKGISFVTYYGQDSKGRDGLSPYLALCDEYHEWEHNDVMDRIQSGMVKVKNPSTWIITTAGYNTNGPNSDFLKACKNILSGVIESHDTLAFIYELDEDDDWRDRDVWIKANPGLGISLTMQGLETEFSKIATEGRQKEIDFKVKNLNIDQSSQNGWIDDEAWMKGADAFDVAQLHGRECWCGLDLANTNDFNAFVIFFPPVYEGDKAYILPYFWLPEDAIEKHRSKRPFVPRWAEEGLIKATDGNVTDYDLIFADIMEHTAPFVVAGFGYDTALSSYLTPRLIEAGFRMEPYSQAPLWLTPPAKFIERLTQSENLMHGGNPVMRWMMANVTMHPTAAGNYYPSKGKSQEKIDGVAATLNAVGQWLKDRGQPQGKSYLFEHEIIVA